jgi:hypothetical protein
MSNSLDLRDGESGREYVKRNRDTIAEILKHGGDRLTRAYAYALLLEYGDDYDIEQVKRELDYLKEREADS